MAGTTVAQDRLRIFDRRGFPICEFRAEVERSWVIGDEGRARFSYPSRQSRIVEEINLQYGNWILIENDLLPDWVGVIDTPRLWGSNIVSICAYSPEHVLAQRRGPDETKINAPAGTIFETLIGYVNSAQETIIRVGDIWRGKVMEETLTPELLSEDLRRIFERSGEEYQWRPIVSNGKLEIYADWTQKLGVNTSGIIQEGAGGGNIEFDPNNVMTEDGPVYNDVMGFGEGSTWDDKPAATLRDEESIGVYGLRQGIFDLYGIKNVTTLKENVRKLLDEYKKPRNAYKVTVMNVGTIYQWLEIGNRLTMQFEHIGFNGGSGLGWKTNVRIMGMMYDNAKPNLVNLVVQEYAE